MTARNTPIASRMSLASAMSSDDSRMIRTPTSLAPIVSSGAAHVNTREWFCRFGWSWAGRTARFA